MSRPPGRPDSIGMSTSLCTALTYPALRQDYVEALRGAGKAQLRKEGEPAVRRPTLDRPDSAVTMEYEASVLVLQPQEFDAPVFLLPGLVM